LARAIAVEWSVPLVLLDPGRIYRKYVGESESRFDAALATVDSMAPAVLWIDEIEKGFSAGGEDGGVSGRVLATFLRWLQDRSPGVFVVATANDVSRLPPELTRKGRFDEVFFVDLPDAPARLEILRTQLAARAVAVTDAELTALATASDGYSGAELDAAIVAASYGGPVTAASLHEEISAAVPLSRSRSAEITTLRAWATQHARAA
jgi:SpoVK/Ycf46/Vps4 family AAA+-type ATPase